MQTTEVAWLLGRYELVRELGRGSQGCTFLGQDHSANQPVAIKKLTMEHVENWKAVELFEREGEALKSLEHPAIPAYVAAFHVEDPEGTGTDFYLVQEFVDGRSFEQIIEEGTRFDEEYVRSFLNEMLNILKYLHGFSPAVLHRDIKPSNILWRTDGRLALVDFGAVQSTADELGGSTIVGTSGYMALEQLMGRACAASDLYALGATAVHLLSHRHPSDLPVDDMAMEFRPFINVSDSLGKFLERLLAPYLEDRFSSAGQALEALRVKEQSMMGYESDEGVIEIRKRSMRPKKLTTEVVQSEREIKVVSTSRELRKVGWFFGAIAVAFLGLIVFVMGFATPVEPMFTSADGWEGNERANIERKRINERDNTIRIVSGLFLMFLVSPYMFRLCFRKKSSVLLLYARDGWVGVKGISERIRFEDIKMMGIKNTENALPIGEMTEASLYDNRAARMMFIQSDKIVIEFGKNIPLPEQRYVLGELWTYVDESRRSG